MSLLDFSNVIYYQNFNLSFHQKMETIWHYVALAINSRRNKRFLYRKSMLRIRFGGFTTITLAWKTLLFLQNTKITVSEVLLFNYSYTQCNKIPAITVKHGFFKNTFLPSAIIEWNKLNAKIKNSESIATFF